MLELPDINARLRVTDQVSVGASVSMTGQRLAVLRNVRYCSSANVSCSHPHACDREDPLNKHLLDVYLPERESGTPPPVVFFVHGGGWRRGHKNGWNHYLSSYDTNLFVYLLLRLFGVYDNVGRSFSRAGVACVVPSYHLAWTPCHLFAAELCVSLLFSLATILPLVWCGSRALANVVWLARFLPEERVGLPLGALLNISILVLWAAMTLRFRYYRKWCLLVLWMSLAVLLVCCDRSMSSVITSGSLSHTAILLSATYITLLANYLSTFTAGDCSTKETLLDLAAAYQWTVGHGRKTGLYDVQRLYVCGHSAGAHLALLGMLKCNIGADSMSCIKGFIGLSGAYNITKMKNSAVSRNFYLKPTFGAEASGGWEKHSPLLLLLAHKHADTKTDRGVWSTTGSLTSGLHLPPTLLITASFDFGLGQQSQELMTALCNRGVAAEHVVLSGHNHFSIISFFGKSACNNVLSRLLFQNRKDAWRHCVAFITRTERNTYQSSF